MLHLAPLLAHGRATTWTLEAALREVLADEIGEVQVVVQQFIGNWVEIDASERWQLGAANSSLGTGAILGTRTHDHTGKFRLVVGPVSQAAYERLRHDTGVQRLIHATVRLLCGDPLEFDVQVLLAAKSLGSMRLTSRGTQTLGADTFLGARQEQSVLLAMPDPMARMRTRTSVE